MEGGKFWNKEQDEDFKNETKKVKKSNVKPERDFGMLDYQMKLKPKVTDFAIEGIIMFKAKKTSDWRGKFTNEKRMKFLEIERNSRKMQRGNYFSTKQQIATQRAQKMSEKVSENVRKKTMYLKGKPSF